jgi:hypothetical protein
VAVIVHFWEILDPRPTFLCGKEPEQGTHNVAPALRVTTDTMAWFGRRRSACKNCLRVGRARVQERAT